MSYANEMTGTGMVRSARARPAVLAADLRISLMRSVRRLRAEKSRTDVSDSQYSVLAVLDRRGPMILKELADYERVQPPSMTRSISALVELGLVSRAAHPVDGRQVVVALTPRGADEIQETRRRRTEWLAQRLAALSAAERDVLATASEILRRVADS